MKNQPRRVTEFVSRLLEQDEPPAPAAPGGEQPPAPNPDADLPEADDSVVNALLGDFLDQYIATALWSSTDNANEQGGEPLDKNYSQADLAPETLERMTQDSKSFLKKFANYVHDKPGDAGHDFWLTRNGHGTGFWDGDWPEADGKKLTAGSEEFGQVDLYVGDDGKLYLS